MRWLSKFARLLTAFAGSVWGMRLCSPWLKSEVTPVFGSGLLLLGLLAFALAMVVNEEVKRDVIEGAVRQRE